MILVSSPTRRADARTATVPFAGNLRSEWVKFFSLPSSALALAGIVIIGIGSSLFLALTLESSGVPSVPSIERTMNDVLMATVVLGQIIAGIIGVMSIGAEYSSGSIAPTLLATPRRLRVLWAKTLVLFSIVAAVALVTAFASWGATYPFYAEHGLEAPLDAPGVLLGIIGVSVYLGLCAAFGVGVGTLVRSTTVGAVVIFVATLLGPIMASVLPFGLFSRAVRVMLLGNAGDAMARVRDETGPFLNVWTGHLSPGAGWVIALVWVVGTLALAAIMLKRRDA